MPESFYAGLEAAPHVVGFVAGLLLWLTPYVLVALALSRVTRWARTRLEHMYRWHVRRPLARRRRARRIERYRDDLDAHNHTLS